MLDANDINCVLRRQMQGLLRACGEDDGTPNAYGLMDCLFIDLSPYYTDPIEEEFEVFLEEQYYFIPSTSNVKGWDDKKPKKQYKKKEQLTSAST